MHLEHVNLTVRDLDRSVDFYTRLFGFNVRWSGRTSNGRRAAHVGTDSYYLALFEADPAKPPRDQDYERPGFNHIGFVTDDIDGLKDRLVELNQAAHSDSSYDPGRHVYFRDPDGNEIELVSYSLVDVPVPA